MPLVLPTLGAVVEKGMERGSDVEAAIMVTGGMERGTDDVIGTGVRGGRGGIGETEERGTGVIEGTGTTETGGTGRGIDNKTHEEGIVHDRDRENLLAIDEH